MSERDIIKCLKSGRSTFYSRVQGGIEYLFAFLRECCSAVHQERGMEIRGAEWTSAPVCTAAMCSEIVDTGVVSGPIYTAGSGSA